MYLFLRLLLLYLELKIGFFNMFDKHNILNFWWTCKLFFTMMEKKWRENRFCHNEKLPSHRQSQVNISILNLSLVSYWNIYLRLPMWKELLKCCWKAHVDIKPNFYIKSWENTLGLVSGQIRIFVNISWLFVEKIKTTFSYVQVFFSI